MTAERSGMSGGTLNDFEAFLQARGLRLTGQRQRIAETFLEAEGHLSADEIYRQVKKRDARIGSATVYRTLKLLREAGLATGMSVGDGFARYEAPSGRGHHDHLICRACGMIVEFENGRIEALQLEVAKKHGFTVTDHKMELYGICGGCRQDSKA
jgi:Fur family ferric uptake transcriptional regulator